jgi:hypothetical protein
MNHGGPKQRLRGVDVEAATTEVTGLLQAIVRGRPGLMAALLETGYGRVVIELPMREWEWGHYEINLKTSGEMPEAA